MPRKKKKQKPTKKQRRIKANRRRRKLNRRPVSARQAEYLRHLENLSTAFPATRYAIDRVAKALEATKLSDPRRK